MALWIIMDVAEMPRDEDEGASIVKNTKYGQITLSPTQIVREGAWAGVWREARVTWRDRQVGFVRIIPELNCVRTRAFLSRTPYRAIWSFSSNTLGVSLMSALRNACEMLVIRYMLSDSGECGMESPYSSDMHCVVPMYAHVDDPYHMDQYGGTWK